MDYRRLHFALAGSLIGTAPMLAQTQTEWTVGGAGPWHVASNWSTLNVPDSPTEQARHTTGAAGGQITLPANYVATIHSFVGQRAALSRNLRLQSGAALTLGYVNNPVPGNGNYGLLLNPGSSMHITGTAFSGFDWQVENSANVRIDGPVLGGNWRVGTSGAINTSIVRPFASVQNSTWRVLLGSTVGTLAQPLQNVNNSVFRFGEDSQSNGGGSLYVNGPFTGGALLMTPSPGNYPSPPTRIWINGLLENAQIDLVSNSLGRPCDTPPAGRPRVSFLAMRSPVGQARFLKVDLEALPGATLEDGDYFFDDSETFGVVSSVIGSDVTYHKSNSYSAPGMPVGAAARVGSFTYGPPAVGEQVGRPSNLHLEGGWIELGPGPSWIENLRIDETGPNACGFGLAALDAHDNGFNLTVGNLLFGAGAGIINSDPLTVPGTDNTAITVEHSLVSDPMGNFQNAAILRTGILEFQRDAQLSAPSLPQADETLTLVLRDALVNGADVYTTAWDCSGVTLRTEANPSLPIIVPPTIEIEVHDVDWGPHWFCNNDGTLDSRVQPYRDFIVTAGTRAKLTDLFGLDGPGPRNDEHAATPFSYEAMFVAGKVTVESGAILDMDKYHIYTLEPPDIQGVVLDGVIEVVTPRPWGTFDADSDIDMDDYAIVLAAYSGPGIPTTNILCDVDGDLDVDNDETSLLLHIITGPGVPAECGMYGNSKAIAAPVTDEMGPTAGFDHVNEAIMLRGWKAGTYDVDVCDASGRVVLSTAALQITEGATGTVQASLLAGAYMVVLRNDAGQRVSRFVVER